MPDTTSPPPTPPAPPVFPLPSMPPAMRSGSLKWGLMGCAGVSVLFIVGMFFLLSKGQPMMESLLRKQMDEVLASAGAEVSAEDKDAFRRAVDPFVEKAKAGKISFDDMSRFQKLRIAALADNRVTTEEIRELTATLKRLAP